jgi:hypothetical protein
MTRSRLSLWRIGMWILVLIFVVIAISLAFVFADGLCFNYRQPHSTPWLGVTIDEVGVCHRDIVNLLNLLLFAAASAIVVGPPLFAIGVCGYLLFRNLP